jgi:hypothetical protein
VSKRVTAKAIGIRLGVEDWEWLAKSDRSSDAIAGAVRHLTDDLQTYFGVHELGRRALHTNRKLLGLNQRDHISAVMSGYARLAQQEGPKLSPFGMTAQVLPPGASALRAPKGPRVAAESTVPESSSPMTIRFTHEQVEWLEDQMKEYELSTSGVLRSVVGDLRRLYVGPLEFRALTLNRERLGVNEREFIGAVLAEYARLVQTLGPGVRPETLAIAPRAI